MTMDHANCKDMIELQRVLSKMRTTEDKIIFKLNCELPTHSFKTLSKKSVDDVCIEIKAKLSAARKLRHELIYRCARENQEVVSRHIDDPKKTNEVTNAHMNLRMLRNENIIEEIALSTTDKIVKERCSREMLS